MLALLVIGMLAVSGCAHHKKPSVATYPWFSSLRENVVTVVPEPTRARQLLTLIDKLELDIMGVIETAEPLRKQLMAMNADYDTMHEDFIALREKLNTNSMAANNKVIAFRAEMKALLTPDEWRQIMRGQETLFEMAVYK